MSNQLQTSPNRFELRLIKGSKFKMGSRVFKVIGVDRSPKNRMPVNYLFHEFNEEPEAFDIITKPAELIEELIQTKKVVLL